MAACGRGFGVAIGLQELQQGNRLLKKIVNSFAGYAFQAFH
jgi:hypothetical protein